MDVNAPLQLLAGLTPQLFMKRHWQKKPLLVRQAFPGIVPPLERAALFEMAGSEDVESRLITRDGGGWAVRSGPLPRRALPAVKQPGWTMLVQGLDLHVAAARDLLSRFRFVPDARLDDLMVSWASDGGGVGPHLDSYDVFLIQLQGRRRWRIGRVKDDRLVEGAPLKILANFEAEQAWLLEPGDMLYLPPRWGHDGVAEGECMTASVGFRAPSDEGIARELLQRLAEADEAPGRLYRDPQQPATATPGALPAGLLAFAAQALEQMVNEPGALARALGEVLTEPKPRVWFEAGGDWPTGQGLRVDARSRLMYDDEHVFINGEAFDAAGRDARLLQRLADDRALPAKDCAGFSVAARALLESWVQAGWLHADAS